jgi:hypothetical protein
MPSYTAKFIAAIDERKRPEGFPKSVYCIGTYLAQNNSHLAEQLNNEMNTIIQQQGMMISTDPEATIDLSNVLVSLENRVFVPIHMITHIRTQVKMMGAMPIPVSTGVLTTDGKSTIEYQTPEGVVIKPS